MAPAVRTGLRTRLVTSDEMTGMLRFYLLIDQLKTEAVAGPFLPLLIKASVLLSNDFTDQSPGDLFRR